MSLRKRDLWQSLSRYTPARIALGRAGGSVRSETLLDFRLAHARARDAVHVPLDVGLLCDELAALGIDAHGVTTQTSDRRTYLLRPDLGRALSAASRRALVAQGWGPRDLVIVVSDGLSALAAEKQLPTLLSILIPALTSRGVTLYPVVVAPYARVKVADEIGELLGARQSLILLGERPGLSAPDGLGAYLTHGPRSACTDADRNCVSNIRPEGLPLELAAHKLVALLTESARRGVSGVTLKEVEHEQLLIA